MKKYLISILLIIVTSNCSAKSDQLIVDQYMSPFAGSALNQSIFHGYMFLDDKYLPSSEGKEDFLWGIGRAAKLSLEFCLSEFLMVVQHEVFGHGYRLREFHFSQIRYGLGIGWGSTGFSDAEFNLLPYTKRAALAAAGMEANAVFSGQIRENWILDDKIDHREALLYFSTYLDQSDYILGTTDDSFNDGNDVNAYEQDINAWYGNTAITKHKLRRYALWDYLDPSLYFGLYSIGNYLLNGSPNTEMYMFDIKNYKYIFSPRLLLAPYGPEFQLQNYILTSKQQLWQVNVRYGNTDHLQSYGVDLLVRPIWRYKGWIFGNKVYLWSQPKFLKQNTAVGVATGLGIAEFVNAEYKLNKCWSAIGEFGYKTAGYIQGIPLGNSWVWRLGIKLSY